MNKKTKASYLSLLYFFLMSFVIFNTNLNLVANDKINSNIPKTSEPFLKELEKKYLELLPAKKKRHDDYLDKIKFNQSKVSLDKSFASRQDQTINIYSSYCNFDFHEEKLNKYAEKLIKFIPSYKIPFYAFLNNKKVEDYNRFIELLVLEYKNKKISTELFCEEITMLIDRNWYNGDFDKLKYLLPYVYDQIQKLGGDQTGLKFYVSTLFWGNEEFSEWHKLPIDCKNYLKQLNVEKRVEFIKFICKSLLLYKKNNIEMSGELSELGLKFFYELMHRMEPDGSLPAIYSHNDRVNLREILYFGSKIYDRDDFRFVSYGGWKNVNALPPLELDICINDSSTFIFRNTWNILETINKREGFNTENEVLGQDSTQLTIEARSGKVSIYSCNYPQMIIDFKRQNLDFQKLESTDSKFVIGNDEIKIEYNKFNNQFQFSFENPFDLTIDFFDSTLVEIEQGFSSKHSQKDSNAIPSANYAQTKFKKRGDSFLIFDNPKAIRIIENKTSDYYPKSLEANAQKSLKIDFKFPIENSD